MAVNIITGIRIVCALSLVFCPTFSTWFFALYLIGGVSDVLDGTAARLFGKTTKFGARFDTAADVVFAAVVIVKIVRAVAVPTWLTIWIVCIAAIKCFNVIMGFVTQKRFVSEHTVMNKMCGVLLFALPFGIGWLSRQTLTAVMIFDCCVATVAAVWEGCVIRIGKTID